MKYNFFSCRRHVSSKTESEQYPHDSHLINKVYGTRGENHEAETQLIESPSKR